MSKQQVSVAIHWFTSVFPTLLFIYSSSNGKGNFVYASKNKTHNKKQIMPAHLHETPSSVISAILHA
jgi:hypothetical protein